VRLETAFGTIRVNEEKERLYRAVRRHLLPEPDGRNVLYSYPGDAWLYLVLPADNATPFSLLAPGFFPVEYFEQTAEILRERRPGTVVVLAPVLSVDDSTAIRRAIDEGYHMVEEVDEFHIYVRNPPGVRSRVE
jgi:hypothetical protein